jgi:biopolymer transport protein ExbD/biopolymer transport protein TolR
LNALVPRPPKSKTEAEPATIVVQVNSGKDGSASYTINQEPFAKAALAPELARIFVSRQQKVMFVKGDANLEYAKVAEVIDLGHQAGVEDVGIITPGAAR